MINLLFLAQNYDNLLTRFIYLWHKELIVLIFGDFLKTLFPNLKQIAIFFKFQPFTSFPSLAANKKE